jgi:hypothetical protein
VVYHQLVHQVILHQLVELDKVTGGFSRLYWSRRLRFSSFSRMTDKRSPPLHYRRQNMAIGDLYQLTVMGRCHGQTILNVLHYAITTEVGITQLTDLVTTFRTTCEAHWRACHSAEYTLDGYLAQKIRPLPINASYEEGPLVLAGTGGAQALPTSVAAVLTKRTDLAGRSYRGRVYLSAIPTTFELDSELTGAALNVYQTLADDLEQILAAGAGNAFTPVLWRRSAELARPITQFVPRQVLRNQRRRQVGRGI